MIRGAIGDVEWLSPVLQDEQAGRGEVHRLDPGQINDRQRQGNPDGDRDEPTAPHKSPETVKGGFCMDESSSSTLVPAADMARLISS